MITLREALEYFIVASLMSIWAGEGYAAYQQCSAFLPQEMFANKQLRWVYGIICEMYETGWECTTESDIVEYICDNGKAPAEKVGTIAEFLIEVYLQFCNMTRPVTGVKWTVSEAVDGLLKEYDYEQGMSERTI